MKLQILTNIYRKLFPSQGEQNRTGLGGRLIASSALISSLSGALAPATLAGCTDRVDRPGVDGGGLPQKGDAGAPLKVTYYDYTSTHRIPPMRDFDPRLGLKIDGMLKPAWEYHIKHRIDDDGRPRADRDLKDLDMDGDKDEAFVYSETVAYDTLLAAWFGDKETFNKIYFGWAKPNLQRINIKVIYTWDHLKKEWIPIPMPDEYKDHLFTWCHLRAVNGNGSPDGIINYQDRSCLNAASDDIEIAGALWFASVWNWDGNAELYLEEARQILHDAWNKYVVKVGDRYIFFAGDQFAWRWELNVSYLRAAYFAYIFPLIDPDHPWHLVADSSYDIISESGSMTIEGHKGKNLVANWNAMNHFGKLVPSRVFEGVAGRSFGRDAVRTLWAVAQASAWFGDTRANSYLTDPDVGPIRFLEKNINPEAFAPTGFDHDGSLIAAIDANTPQTLGLNTEQIFMYGPLVNFFHYGGKVEMTNRALWRINEAFVPAGYWGNDPDEYFTQIWMLLGLKLLYGLPPELEKGLAELPRPIISEAEEKPTPKKSETKPKFNREWLVEKLGLDRMKSALKAITDDSSKTPLWGGDSPQMLTKRYPQLKKLHELGLARDFRSFPNYWNKAITMLAAYSQEIIEQGQKGELPEAIQFCQEFRARIDRESPGYTPNAYKRALLDLTEASLRARINNQEADFYKEGIKLSVSTIKHVLALRLPDARPDYYTIINALSTIGDLYLRMYEAAERKESTAEDYMERARKFYDYVVRSKEPITIDDRKEPGDIWEKTGLHFSFSPKDIEISLSSNYEKGYLTDTEYAEASGALACLRASALAKVASLFIRQKGEKTVDDVRKQIKNARQSAEDLEAVVKTENDFFLSFARIVEADLLLFLADRIKFYYWPENGSNLNSLARALDDIEKSLNLSPTTARGNTKEHIIKRIFALNDEIIEQAEELYKKTPSKFAYLFDASQIKLLEIAVRTKKFMDHEARFLSPFYTHPVLLSNPIPDGQFLSIEKSYLIALSLSSTERKEDIDEAEALLLKVLQYAKELNPPYDTYFIIHSKLKMAQILFKRRDYKAAVKNFEEIKDMLGRITPEHSREMGWRTDSFEAEFYYSWATTLEAMGREAESRKKAEIALEKCYLSDLEYDGKIRRKIIHRDFNLEREDEALQEKYGRSFENEY